MYKELLECFFFFLLTDWLLLLLEKKPTIVVFEITCDDFVSQSEIAGRISNRKKNAYDLIALIPPKSQELYNSLTGTNGVEECIWTSSEDEID